MSSAGAAEGPSDQGMPWWVRAIAWVGVPTAALFALGYVVTQAAKWSGEHVFDPLVKNTIATQNKITQTQDKLAENSTVQTQLIGELRDEQKATREEVKLNRMALEKFLDTQSGKRDGSS
jgi:hypothetical protein